MPQESEGAIPLPDIKEALKKKEQEEQLARMEEEKEANKIKIKRTDKEALLKVSPKILTTVSMDATNHN